MPTTESDDTPLMFPLMLNVTSMPIMLVGGGELAERLVMLREHGATNIHIFAPDADDNLNKAGAGNIEARLPEPGDFLTIKPAVMFVSDIDDDIASGLRDEAKKCGALVHVQDRIPLCDFHLPARVRRGHLQVTISTDGKVAGLSRLLREYLETNVFGPEWAGRIDELASARLKWKAEGLSFGALGDAIRKYVSEKGWLNRG